MKPSVINDLDDDSLIEIFSYLTDPYDLIHLDQVCEKWKALSPYVWRRKEKIRIKNFTDLNCVRKALSCCGKKITYLSLNLNKLCKRCESYRICSCHDAEIIRQYYLNLLSQIIGFYKHLQYFFIYCDYHLSDAHDNSLQRLLSNIPASNLRSLNLFEICNLSDDILGPILSQTTGLESLSVYCACIKLTGESFFQLPKKLKSLDIGLCDLQKDVMINVFKELPNLEKLKVYGNFEISFDMLRNQHNLVVVDTGYSFFHDPPGLGGERSVLDLNLLNVSPFLKVKVLNLRYTTYLNHKMLAITTLYPHLEDLDLSECWGASDTEGGDDEDIDLAPLAKLLSLKILRLDCIGDEFKIVHLGCQFEKLEVLQCMGFTQGGLMWMIDLCPNLRILKVSCDFSEYGADLGADLGTFLHSIHPRKINIFLNIPRFDRNHEEMEEVLNSHHPLLHLYRSEKNTDREHDDDFYNEEASFKLI